MWIDRRDAYWGRMQSEICDNAAAQIANGREVPADKTWTVEPTSIL